jgi:dTDP-4-amino-4,6-dideoxygalactose transaminase
MEAVQAMADAARVGVVADGAQSQGARRSGQKMGAFAAITATSFYPGKNLGAAGDAGGVLTSDDELARRVRLMANHGSEVRYHHEIVGMNSRLDHVQAIVLRAKLTRLEDWNGRRREIAARYDELLRSIPSVRRPSSHCENTHVWHLYVIEVSDRDAVLSRLNEQGVGASVHYPVPLHLQPAFRHLGHSVGDFPVAERAAARILSLPMFPGMTDVQIERVVEALAVAAA